MAHLGFEALENHNRLEKFLNEKDITYKMQNTLATHEDLLKLKEIFKDTYWENSTQWTEFATEQTLLEWSKDYLKYTIDSEGLLSFTTIRGKTERAWGGY